MTLNLAVTIVGIVFICLAVLVLVKPLLMKTVIAFVRPGKRIYIAAAVRFALAVLFLLAANQCKIPNVIGVLGLIFLAAGLIIVIAGPDRLRPILGWFEKQSTIVARALGVLVLLIGGLIVYAA